MMRRWIAMLLLVMSTTACVGTTNPEETGSVVDPYDVPDERPSPTTPVFLQEGYIAGHEDGVAAGYKARDRELRAEAHSAQARYCGQTVRKMVAAVEAWNLHALSVARNHYFGLDCSLVGHSYPVAFSQKDFG